MPNQRRQLVRWVFTAGSSAIIVGILWGYEKKGVTEPKEKRIFNFLIQASILAISLNFIVSHGIFSPSYFPSIRIVTKEQSSIKETAVSSVPIHLTQLKDLVGSYTETLIKIADCENLPGILYLVSWVLFALVSIVRSRRRFDHIMSSTLVGYVQR
jgi:hypothetical protein